VWLSSWTFIFGFCIGLGLELCLDVGGCGCCGVGFVVCVVCGVFLVGHGPFLGQINWVLVLRCLGSNVWICDVGVGCPIFSACLSFLLGVWDWFWSVFAVGVLWWVRPGFGPFPFPLLL